MFILILIGKSYKANHIKFWSKSEEELIHKSVGMQINTATSGSNLETRRVEDVYVVSASVLAANRWYTQI